LFLSDNLFQGSTGRRNIVLLIESFVFFTTILQTEIFAGDTIAEALVSPLALVVLVEEVRHLTLEPVFVFYLII